MGRGVAGERAAVSVTTCRVGRGRRWIAVAAPVAYLVPGLGLAGGGGWDSILAVAVELLLVVGAWQTWRASLFVDSAGIHRTARRSRHILWPAVAEIRVHPSPGLVRQVMVRSGLAASVVVVPREGRDLVLHLDGVNQTCLRRVWEATLAGARRHAVPVRRTGAGGTS